MTSAIRDAANDASIYPSYCHRLSPTFHKWVPMLARDVVALRRVDGFNGQGIYFHLNHPIKYVKLTGVVIAMDEFPGMNGGRVIVTLDDSSGVSVECTCAAPPKPNLPIVPSAPVKETNTKMRAQEDKHATSAAAGKAEELKEGQSPDGPSLIGLDVGSVVKIKGGLGVFRGTMQIRLKRIQILRETNQEVLAWREVVAFHKEVLSRPWRVRREKEEMCRVQQQKEEGKWKRQAEEEKRLKREEERRVRREVEKKRRRQAREVKS